MCWAARSSLPSGRTLRLSMLHPMELHHASGVPAFTAADFCVLFTWRLGETTPTVSPVRVRGEYCMPHVRGPYADYIMAPMCSGDGFRDSTGRPRRAVVLCQGIENW